ncbi:MAG TPA: mechanosensitive ion channel domain-containing protein [Luteitalea sp.]|nr:mechanosensitive ion channel domain-containing protein [Luteitalea sp.]
MLNNVFAGYPYGVRAGIAAAIVLVLAYFIAELVSRVLVLLVERVDRHVPGDLTHRKATRAALRAVRLIIALLLSAVLIFPAMSLVGIRSRVGLSPERLADWATGSGLRICLIALLSWLIVHVVGLVVKRIHGEVGTATNIDVMERAKRAQTLGSLVQNTVYTLVSCIATLMILRELAVDITPILTGAGIVGLAVGFGAQTLVKDIISGFFIILENQVRVGDVANIDGTGGLVERITLRTIVLRDETGTVHVMPNGSIQRLSNLTKDFSFYVTSIGVSYKEDTDRVTKILVDVAEEMLTDPAFAPAMLGPLEVLGVDRFADAAVEVKVRLKTVPIKQWFVGREFLRRVKHALDKAEIEIPTRNKTVVVAPAAGSAGEPGPLAADPQAAPPNRS